MLMRLIDAEDRLVELCRRVDPTRAHELTQAIVARHEDDARRCGRILFDILRGRRQGRSAPPPPGSKRGVGSNAATARTRSTRISPPPPGIEPSPAALKSPMIFSSGSLNTSRKWTNSLGLKPWMLICGHLFLMCESRSRYHCFVSLG